MVVVQRSPGSIRGGPVDGLAHFYLCASGHRFYTRSIVMDHPDLVNLIKRMKAITAAVRVRIEEIRAAKNSPPARKTHQDADLQAIREEGYRIRKAMTALFRTQEYLLRTDRGRWATRRYDANKAWSAVARLDCLSKTP